MRYLFIIILFSLSSFLIAQNHTAVTKRSQMENADTLSENQIRIFSQMLQDMVFVDGGTYLMGKSDSIEDGMIDNQPKHLVNISPFFISRYEVSQEEWEIVMGSNPSYFKGKELPVENVSWNECMEYIRRLNKVTGMEFRLPTEAEWEYAAKGGKHSLNYKYAGSEFVKSVAWFQQNSGNSTHKCGLKRPNELGIYDMSGNVAEWCYDIYNYDYYKYSVYDNPTGPEKGDNKVNRGGGWLMNETYQRTDVRNVNAPNEKNASVGLRLAM